MPYPCTLPESNDASDLIQQAFLSTDTITGGVETPPPFSVDDAKKHFTQALWTLPLVDRLFEVKSLRKELEKLEADFTEGFKNEYEIGELVVSRSGTGYKFVPQVKKTFGDSAIKALISRGLAADFMKVSLASIQKLVKAKKLSKEDAALLIDGATDVTTYRLQEQALEMEENDVN